MNSGYFSGRNSHIEHPYKFVFKEQVMMLRGCNHCIEFIRIRPVHRVNLKFLFLIRYSQRKLSKNVLPLVVFAKAIEQSQTDSSHISCWSTPAHQQRKDQQRQQCGEIEGGEFDVIFLTWRTRRLTRSNCPDIRARQWGEFDVITPCKALH